MKIILSFLLIVLCSGCYRFPGDEDFSTVPATNNPRVTGEKAESNPMMPSVGY